MAARQAVRILCSTFRQLRIVRTTSPPSTRVSEGENGGSEAQDSLDSLDASLNLKLPFFLVIQNTRLYSIQAHTACLSLVHWNMRFSKCKKNQVFHIDVSNFYLPRRRRMHCPKTLLVQSWTRYRRVGSQDLKLQNPPLSEWIFSLCVFAKGEWLCQCFWRESPRSSYHIHLSDIISHIMNSNYTCEISILCLIFLYNVEAEHFQTFELAVFSKGGSLMMFLQFIGLFDICFNLFRVARCSGLWAPALNFGWEKDTQNRNDRNDQAATSEDHAIWKSSWKEWPLPKNLVAWRCGPFWRRRINEDLTLQ